MVLLVNGCTCTSQMFFVLFFCYVFPFAVDQHFLLSLTFYFLELKSIMVFSLLAKADPVQKGFYSFQKHFHP